MTLAGAMGAQLLCLFVLALPIASITWTLTHEEIFQEPREFCLAMSRRCRSIIQRKFFYILTCEYCFSHYVTLLFLLITRYKLLYQDWRGYLVAGFALVWILNQYISIYGHLRLGIKRERVEIKEAEVELRQREGKTKKAA